MITGVDVSDYQPDTDWAKVQQNGQKFAFVKATEGGSFVNPYFNQDWNGIKAQGLFRGAYHFFRPLEEPIQQADHFLQTIGPLRMGDLPPVLDFETSATNAASEVADALKWLEYVEKQAGRIPILYSNPEYLLSLGNQTEYLSYYGLWIADYKISSPKIPAPWTTYLFWQMSDIWTVSGISGPCDMNYFNGTIDQLMSLADG